MKKIFAMMAVMAATIFGVNAQSNDNKTVGEQRMETRHEISIGFGDNIPMGLAHIIAVDLPEMMIEEALGTGYEYGSTTISHQLSLDYGYRLAPKDVVTVGGTYCWGSAKIQECKTNVKVGTRNDNYTTLMIGYRRDWVQKKHFTFYSKAQAGVMIMHYERNQEGLSFSDTSASFMAQVNPLGMELGGKHAAYFYELGFGQTFIQTGLRVRF